MSRPLLLEFLASASEVGRLPASRAEIAFVGRSNVGKSSLLNAIAAGQVARVSNTPGRTRTLDCFRHGRGDSTVVDCPGIGYARVSKRVRGSFLPMLERYLVAREPLRMVLMLVDGEIGPTASDLHMLQWLDENGVPHRVIATKLDKVRSSFRERRHLELAAKCQLPASEVVRVSAAKNLGIDELRDLVRQWLR